MLHGIDAEPERLRAVRPYLIDLSLRENVFGARVGETLADKLGILPQLRAFGFENILLGTLDYPLSDELEVDDDFMCHLRDHGIDTTGGFAFTDIGRADAHAFAPVALETMIRLMRRDLRAGLRIVYDEPAQLLQLCERACAT